ncbi:MAG: hypothetical protein EWV53_03500 [Microcystis panniformis Mp_MB_F_20051200_S9]|uniref:Uncharacterized protein n=1 Tax=Microcystis panniformis Mp_MB_F_20051200_S9 TaxID=2486223 RepID=A0A552Q8L9_9CHRO|nr:MAG: hypothetical protein EWV43_21130 [Microcystis panniformis Mp_MB_F_20080800_S26D]TRV45951.1 MAG: hypothetical protein EWV42_18825 [Microcystis panniformis Mp_GB_SS_20050300_S99D]TRV46702.1 MAG: hypothetical protein EWV87_15335 [Microcystis panniformis Mp_GB_SS_20050300_S99]TRV58553.1 MAG: hypothetical protein EWV69_13540 [Microcystis panniformis Mp_MB_F_20080800_S26]TRV63861.1 MAG: hypothetical protein EWV86_11405 [Microcystis panniformis Mp_MB_F_20051200_S9D]TRV65553.1 MAG: hypothetica
MSEENITIVTREQWAKLKGKTDWKKVKGMSEAEIQKNALEDADNPPLPADFFDEVVEVVESTPASLNP